MKSLEELIEKLRYSSSKGILKPSHQYTPNTFDMQATNKIKPYQMNLENHISSATKLITIYINFIKFWKNNDIIIFYLVFLIHVRKLKF